MPLKKNYRKKQKTYKPRKPRKSKKQNIPVGVPEKHIAKLRYFETVFLDATGVGLVTPFVFRANSLYDPNVSGTGHQPRFYDQWSLLYEKATVIGSKITIIPTSDSNTSLDFIVGAMLDTNTITSTDARNYMEGRRVSKKVISPNTAPTDNKIVLNFDLKKMSKSSRPLSDDNLSHTTSSNPIDQWYYNFFLFNPGQAVTPGASIQFNVTIDFIVMFHDVILPPVS